MCISLAVDKIMLRRQKIFSRNILLHGDDLQEFILYLNKAYPITLFIFAIFQGKNFE